MKRLWETSGAYLLAVGFVIAIGWLTFRQYATYQLYAPDVATFGQAIWNTLHGRFLYASIIRRSILAYHFSPFLALLSPLLLIWSDIRILFVAQTIGLAATGLILYRLMRQQRPALAPWFLLAFYLNPALHEVALHELRRVIFAAPFIALALYGLHGRRYRLMAIALGLALLCKEDISLIVLMMGVFLIVFRRVWHWGGALIVLGLAWALIVPFCVIPSFHPQATSWACTADYPQLTYFDNLASPAAETETDPLTSLIEAIWRSPSALWQRLFDTAGWLALWRVFLPLGLMLPFLGGDWLLMALPTMGLFLLSGWQPMHELRDWYMASLMPILFTAVAVGLLRLPRRYQSWGVGWLLATTLLGYWLYSPAPPSRHFIPLRYQFIDHHHRAREVLAMLPSDAAVAAQDAFLAHLALRQQLYHYPWYDPTQTHVDYLILDRHSRHYPFDQAGIGYEIDNQIADTQQVIRAEVDGIFLFEIDGAHHPAVQIERTAEASIHLERAEIAATDERGFFGPLDPANTPPTLQAGQTVRITLYWRALDYPRGERTVSVRLLDATGALVAQQDMQPSQGARPTSWWEPGWYFRDVYYLTVPPTAVAGAGSVELLLYDSFTQERVPFGDDAVLTLMSVGFIP